MADGTHIEWTEATWNVVTGCTKVSAGCDHCYIERTPPFRMAGRKFDKPGTGGTTSVQLHPERLTLPLKWRKPRRIFVNSLSDLFHDDVPDKYIAEVFACMGLAEWHVFQLLTKRHARMRSLLGSPTFRVAVLDAAYRMVLDSLDVPARAKNPYWARYSAALNGHGAAIAWPLPNVWLGVSVEDQQWADIRIPALLDTPAAVRWLSCEPLLGPLNLTGGGTQQTYWLTGRPYWGEPEPIGGGTILGRAPLIGPRLDWIVVGGESGPGARPMELDWARSLVEQCRSAGTPVFVKQLGSVWAKDWTWNGLPVSRFDPKGGDPDYWPADLRVREYPGVDRG